MLTSVVLLAACESSTDVPGSTSYGAMLTGAQEVPPTASIATGQLSAVLNHANSAFSYSVTWSGLTGSVTEAHIHGPATATQTANILVDFAATPPGSTDRTMTTGASGSAAAVLDLTQTVTATVSGDSLRKLLDLGLLYVNVHTAANPNGEIRGQIVKQ